MTERIYDQIQTLRQPFNQAEQNDYSHTIFESLKTNHTEDLNQRYSALTTAYINNVIDTVKHNQSQIRYTLEFWKYVTGYGRQITPNVSFWANQINDDIGHLKLIEASEKRDLAYLGQQANPKLARALTETSNELWTDLKKRFKNKANDQAMFDGSEIPTLEEPEQGILSLRHTQLKISQKQIDKYMKRSLVNLGNIQFLNVDYLPALKQNNDPGADDIAETTRLVIQEGRQCLDLAQDILNHDAARFSAFPRALNNTKLSV